MQLHEFVDAVTGDEPPLMHSADDIISAGRKAERRRRAGFASAGAAGLVAVAVAGAFVLPHAGGKASTGTEAGPSTAIGAGAQSKASDAKWTDAAPFTFTFSAFTAGKFHVQTPTVASTAYQIASVYEDGHTTNDKPVSSSSVSSGSILKDKENAAKLPPTLYAYLTLYNKGAFDPSTIKNGTTTTIDGHKAVQATLPFGLAQTGTALPGNKELAWEYTDGAWAVVTSISGSDTDPSFADLGALVSGLKPSTPSPALVPFTVGYVPAGYTAVQSGTTVMPGLNGIAAAREGDFGGATFAKPAPATTGLSGPYDQVDGTIKNSFDIYVTPSTSSNQKAEAGKTKCYSAGFCNIWSADGKVQVEVNAEGTGANLSAAELTKIAKSVKVADVHAQSSWTPAATALKG